VPDTQELIDEPSFYERGILQTMMHGERKMAMPTWPVRFDGSQPKLSRLPCSASTLPRCLPIGSASTLSQSRPCVRMASSDGFGAPRPNEMAIADGGPLAIEPNEAGPAQRAPARG
jgi:hypothetical protein